MDALKFMLAFNDICGEFSDCRNGCPLYGTEFCSKAFGDISEEGYKEAVRLIKTWLDDKEKVECICQREAWEEGETFYFSSSWDGGIDYNYIHNVKFCPVCGRKLPEREL